MSELKFCADCTHSSKAIIQLRCKHPKLLKNSSVALASSDRNGVLCFYERLERGWFAKCGIKGKLWEPKKN